MGYYPNLYIKGCDAGAWELENDFWGFIQTGNAIIINTNCIGKYQVNRHRNAI